MKKCLAIAVLLLASSLSTAQAQYSFEYGGRTITIDPDRGTVHIPGVYDNTGKKAKRSRGEEGDLDRPGRKAPQQAKSAPQAAPEAATPAAPAPAEQAVAPAAAPARPCSARPSHHFEGRAVDRDGGRCAGGYGCACSARASSTTECRSGCTAGATAAATETGRRPRLRHLRLRTHRSACG